MTKPEDSKDENEKAADERSEEQSAASAGERERAKAGDDDERAGEPARPEDDEDEDEDQDEEEDEPAPAPKRAATGTAARAKATQPPRRGSAPAAPASSIPLPRVALFVFAALAAGAAGGWFGHEAQAKARIRAESAAAPAGSGQPTGPCGAWQHQICERGGDTSAVCAQAKGAVELLTDSSCESALGMMPATLAKLKAARASCDSLVGRLCKDLPQGSQACDLVKEKTPAFPSQRCDEMLKHYDEVLANLRQLDQQAGGMRPAPGNHPPMSSPAH